MARAIGSWLSGPEPDSGSPDQAPNDYPGQRLGLPQTGPGSLARMGRRFAALFGATVSVGALVHDLGRPERFLNMLRVFRISSPMSMGSWILSIFSSCAGAAADR